MMSASTRRRLRWTATGFVAGYVVAYCLQLIDLTNPHFEVLYETTRPGGLIAVLRFQHSFEAGFVLVGLVAAVLGYVASFVARGTRSIERAI
jgi:hypothetical protein